MVPVKSGATYAPTNGALEATPTFYRKEARSNPGFQLKSSLTIGAGTSRLPPIVPIATEGYWDTRLTYRHGQT